MAPGMMVYETPLENRNSHTASTTEGCFNFSVGLGTISPHGCKPPQVSPPSNGQPKSAGEPPHHMARLHRRAIEFFFVPQDGGRVSSPPLPHVFCFRRSRATVHPLCEHLQEQKFETGKSKLAGTETADSRNSKFEIRENGNWRKPKLETRKSKMAGTEIRKSKLENRIGPAESRNRTSLREKTLPPRHQGTKEDKRAIHRFRRLHSTVYKQHNPLLLRSYYESVESALSVD